MLVAGKAPKDNFDDLCNLTGDSHDVAPWSRHKFQITSNKRHRKPTAVMKESQSQEGLSPKKKPRTQKNEAKSKENRKNPKSQTQKSLLKKAEESSAVHAGHQVLQSLSVFQSNFPSRRNVPSSNETTVRPVQADNQAPPPSKVIPSPVQALRPTNSPFTTVETSPVQPITSAYTLSPVVLISSMQATTVVQSFPETTTSQLLPRTGLAADVVMPDTVVHGTPATVKPLPIQQNTPNHISPATVDSQVQNSVPAHFQRQQIPSSTTD